MGFAVFCKQSLNDGPLANGSSGQHESGYADFIRYIVGPQHWANGDPQSSSITGAIDSQQVFSGFPGHDLHAYDSSQAISAERLRSQ